MRLSPIPLGLDLWRPRDQFRGAAVAVPWSIVAAWRIRKRIYEEWT
jgi:hypothetical protein